MCIITGLLILSSFPALIFFAVLFFPGRIEADVVWGDSANRAVFQALFVRGLLGFQIQIDTDRVFHLLIIGKKMPGFSLGDRVSRSEKKGETSRQKTTRRIRLSDLKKLRKNLKNHRFFIGEIFNRLTIHQLCLDLDLGLLNPAATGAVYGLVLPLARLLPHRVDIRLHPDFTGFRFESRFRARLSVIPVTLIPPVGKLLFHNRLRFCKFE